MNLRLPLVALSLCLAAVAQAQDSWQILLLNGQEAGYAHNRVRTLRSDGATLYETAQDMAFRIKRMGTAIEFSTTLVQTENAAGQIVKLRQALDFSKNQTLYEGEVRDGKLHVIATTVGPPHRSTIDDWPSDIPGPEEQKRRILATGFQTGAIVPLNQFDFTLGEPMSGEIRVAGEEMVQIDGKPRRLFRTVLHLDGPGLPDTTSWLDEQGNAVKASFDMLGMSFETIETDEARIAAWRNSGDPAEIFMQTTVTANVRLPRPRSLDSVTYLVKAKDGQLADMERQNQHWLGAADADGARLLRIDSQVPGDNRKQRVGMAATGSLGEFLISNPMMQCDAQAIVDFARGQIIDENDAWRAAVRLERAVYEKIDKKSMDVAFASALETFQTCTGDCSEHAVLLGTLCRAVGIPARVVMGLVYVGGIFGGHAWTEVNIDGRWYALDGTIGRGSADATHIALGASSLKDGSFSSGLLQSLTGLGNLNLNIVEYRQGSTTVRVDQSKQRSSIADGRFIDYLEGVSFAIPEGFAVSPGTPDILEMSNRFVIAALASSDASSECTLELSARQVAYDYSLDRLVDEVSQRLGRTPRTIRTRIADHDGIVLVDGGASIRIAGVLIDDTLYALNGRALDDAGLAAFEGVIRSLQVH